VELRRTTREDIDGLRATRRRASDLPIVPGFYAGLVEEAEPFLLVGGAQEPVGYALLLGREHDGHVHTTLIELGLDERSQDRYEDALDLIREKAKPTAYLVRTDDCRLNATLLARGLQVEATALVMVPESSGPGAASGAGGSGPAAAGGRGPEADLDLALLKPEHLPALAELLMPDGLEGEQATAHHHHGPTAAETLDEVRAMAQGGGAWVLLEDGRPQAVVARLEADDSDYELLDFVVAHGEEAGLSWALSRAAGEVRAAGRRPAAVIDALDPVRRRILRGADFYTAAAYMVFYDPMAGRPSVPTVSLEELREMIGRKERFRLVDVMGEEHWRAGHIPGSEWIDFRMLGREAKRRYQQDETIVVYCNGFT
jgi:hypothetical protein